jgi:hypothetical protein
VDEQKLLKLIEGSEKLTAIFGRWPSFHDAEIIELHMCCDESEVDASSMGRAVLKMKIVLWELTSTVKPNGYLETKHHTLAEFCFHGITQLTTSGFGPQNAIFELDIIPEMIDGRRSFQVHVDPTTEFELSFRCERVQILNATPCSPEVAVTFRRAC